MTTLRTRLTVRAERHRRGGEGDEERRNAHGVGVRRVPRGGSGGFTCLACGKTRRIRIRPIRPLDHNTYNGFFLEPSRLHSTVHRCSLESTWRASALLLHVVGRVRWTMTTCSCECWRVVRTPCVGARVCPWRTVVEWRWRSGRWHRWRSRHASPQVPVCHTAAVRPLPVWRWPPCIPGAATSTTGTPHRTFKLGVTRGFITHYGPFSSIF